MPETTEKQDTAKADAKAKEDAKKAEEQAKQNDADVETFLSFHRGEALVRENYHVDLPAFLEAREAAAEAEKADSEKKE